MLRPPSVVQAHVCQVKRRKTRSRGECARASEIACVQVRVCHVGEGEGEGVGEGVGEYCLLALVPVLRDKLSIIELADGILLPEILKRQHHRQCVQPVESEAEF